jgi:hypothetical protein
MYRAFAADPELRELYRSGEAMHEVPFTLVSGGRVLRGTIDCLLRVAPDRVVVLEFKTSRPRAGHEMQTALYRDAAQTIFPDATVESRIVYADPTPR